MFLDILIVSVFRKSLNLTKFLLYILHNVSVCLFLLMTRLGESFLDISYFVINFQVNLITAFLHIL